MALQAKVTHESIQEKAVTFSTDTVSHPEGSHAVFLNLPSIEFSGQARKLLEPLHAYTCTTVGGHTKGGNYKVLVESLESQVSVRIPAESMIFVPEPLTAEKFAGVATLIEHLIQDYQTQLEILLAPFTSKVAIPDELAIYYPKTTKDIPAAGRPYFIPGRAHVVKLADTLAFKHQSITLENPTEDFTSIHVNNTLMSYQVPQAVMKQIQALANTSDQTIWDHVKAYLATPEAIQPASNVIPIQTMHSTPLTASVSETTEVLTSENLPVGPEIQEEPLVDLPNAPGDEPVVEDEPAIVEEEIPDSPEHEEDLPDGPSPEEIYDAPEHEEEPDAPEDVATLQTELAFMKAESVALKNMLVMKDEMLALQKENTLLREAQARSQTKEAFMRAFLELERSNAAERSAFMTKLFSED